MAFFVNSLLSEEEQEGGAGAGPGQAPPIWLCIEHHLEPQTKKNETA